MRMIRETLSGSKGAMKGFYIGPYLKYTTYRAKFGVTYDDQDFTGMTFDVPVQAELKFNTLGIGAQMGVQWMINDRVSIDWHFLGIGAAKNTLVGTLISKSTELIDMRDFEAEVEGEGDLIDIPVVGNNIKVESSMQEIEVKAPFWGLDLRSGLSIGIAF